MLKTRYLTVILLLTTSLLAKDIIVTNTKVLLGDNKAPFYFPSYTVDGKSIMLTQNAYSGLWMLDRTSEELRKVTDSQGAGFEPRSLIDGTVIYRRDEYQKGRKFTSLYKYTSNGEQLIADPARLVSPANVVDDRLIYLIDEVPVILNASSAQREINLEDYTTVLNDKLTLKLFQSGEPSVIAPQGEGNYIWSELSPTLDKLVYTKTGVGTFVSDLDGNIISDLGIVHAPHWSPDGEYLVYMKDLDDGVQYTESEIWIVSFDGEHSWKITDTPERIEMYPQWAPDGKHVIYHSLLGDIIETTLEIVE